MVKAAERQTYDLGYRSGTSLPSKHSSQDAICYTPPRRGVIIMIRRNTGSIPLQP